MHRVVVGLALTLSACAGGEEPATTDTGPGWPATCDASASTGLCYAWGGEQTADHAQFAELCEGTYGGTYGDAACPEADVVGTCETDQGFGLLLDYVYYASDYDEDSARTHCEGLASCDFSCTFVPSGAGR